MRLRESVYPQAVQLYTDSLQFEDIPDTRVDLAIADLSADRADDSIAQATKALASEPDNARAEVVLGKAFASKHETAKASRALARAMELKSDPKLQYALAATLLATKNAHDKQRAELLFQQMIRTEGDSGRLHVYFGRAYNDAGDMPDAIREFRRAIQMDPATPHAHSFLGLSLLQMNAWKPTPEAEKEFKEELRYHPNDFLANYILGFDASSTRQYATANKYLEAAAQADPGWPEPWLYLGLNAYDQGNMRQSEEALRKAIALTGQDESRSNYEIRRAYIDLGRILANSGRQPEADKYLAKARELQNKVMAADQRSVASMGGADRLAAMVPLDKQRESQSVPTLAEGADPFARAGASVIAQAHLTSKERAEANAQEANLRLVLAQSFSDLATSEAMQRNYPAALEHYQQAAQWNDAVPGLAKNLGQCAFRVKNYPLAAQWLSRYVAQDPNASAAIRAMLGVSYYAAEKYAEAANTFTPLGAAGMKDPTVGYLWADALARGGDFKNASAVLAEYENGNLSPEKLLLVGQLWIQVADYARAVAAFHRALRMEASLPKAHYYAGEADIHWEHWADAAKEFQAELDLVPTDPDAKYDLGFVDLHQSKPADAEKLFEQVIAAHPDHANAQYELGKLLLQQGKPQEAVPHLEIAARLSPSADYMHYQLQTAYRKEGRTADADRELAIYSALKAKSRPRMPAAAGPNH